jgi:hypothetical protein
LGDGVEPTLPKRRRVQQNWMAVHSYGTAEFWTRLQDPAMPGSCKLNLILQLAIDLGCRLPTEPSLKWMTSWWLAVAEDPAEVAKMDGGAKKAMLAHLKATFDGLRKAAGDPVVFLDKLPDNPVSFLRDSPSLYHGCFMAGPPVVPAMSIQVIAAIDMSYGCRGGAAKLQPQASPAVPAVSLQLGDSPMERMCGMVFQRMESMATAQQRFMEMAMGSSSLHRPTPRPLAALADNSPMFARKLPTITFGGGCLALGDASSPPPTAASSDSLAIPADSGEMADSAPLAVESGEFADLSSMLDMIAARKAGNAAKAANAAKSNDKGKGKGSGGATGEDIGEDIGHAGAVKGQGKGKGTGEVPGDAGDVKGNGKGKSNGKSKSNGKVTLKAKAKAGNKAAAKAVAKPVEKAVVLGCSKCRYSTKGCKQCKNPEYNGHRYS